MQGRAAGHTGANNGVYAADRQAGLGPFAYSVQGNILTGAAVLDQTETGFRAEGCDLAARLMRALEAGGANGQGDSRCTGSGIPSDSAFIEVEREGEAAGSYLRLEVTGTAPNNPLPLLRERFDAWRATHPCPPPKPASDGGTFDGGGGSGGDGGGNPGDSKGSAEGAGGEKGAQADGFAACGVMAGGAGGGAAGAWPLALALALASARRGGRRKR